MLSYRYLLCFGIVISMTSALGCNRMTSLPPENEVQASDAILPQNDAQQPVAELSNGEQPVMQDAQQPNSQIAETPTADADEDSVTPEDALAKRIREYDVNEYSAHTDYEKVYLFPKQYPDGYSNGQCRAANCKCGENTCLRDEYCVKDRCKTKFDHDIMMEPTRLDAAEVVDNGDYWECAAESCKYTYNPRTAYPKNEAINYTTSGSTKTITLPRGVRARGNELYCGGEKLPAEQFDKSKCTDDGWICYAPNGCSHYFKGGEHEDPYNVTCSPGQHLEDDDYLVAKSDGHNMSLWGYCENRHATDENVKYCPTENCECGEHLCGKNQYCAFGHCYYQGKIYQGFGDYQFVELQGSECDDAMTTTRSSSIINHIVCNRPEGCHCRNEGRAPKDAEVCKENLLNIEFNKPESGNYAYVQYDSSSEGCPESIFFLWQCSESQDSSTCLCGNTTCPAGAFCANGTCYLDFVAGKFLYKPKPAHDDYIAKDYMWKCAPGKSCQCDDRQLPANAHCYIDLNGKEHAVWDEWIPQNNPSVSDEYFMKACSTDDCICNGQKLPENAVCHVDPQREWIACGNDRLDNITGYRCDAKTKKWLCADEINGCLCGDRKLPLNTYCKQISDRDAETFCGDKIMPRTEGHLCVNDKIVCGKPDGECMCGDRKLPPNTSCVLHFDEWSGKCDYDMALCGDEVMLLSEGYECINNKITCTKPDGDCLCVGHHSVDAENAECKAVYNREAKTFEEVYTCAQTHYYMDDILYKDHAVHYSTFEFHDFEDDVVCEKYRCSEDGWDCEIEKTNPNSDPKTEPKKELSIKTDFHLKAGKTCEHVRGCFCQKELCPVTGQCTDQGCIDPLTSKPFEKKDGYLVSGFMKQCELKEGCKCGDKTTPYREYCLNDKPQHLVFSGIRDNKRMLCEDNYDPNTDIVEARKNKGSKCFDETLDPEQYMMKDCVTAHGTPIAPCFSDEMSYDYTHLYISQCMLNNGCSCGKSQCRQGESCIHGRCIADYQCHVGFSTDDDINIKGKEEVLGAWWDLNDEDK